MKIKKIGHCCLLIEEKGLRILTDPGSYSTGQNEIKDINIIVITHEHQDHLHIESLKQVLENNPQAGVVTNSSVGKILEKEAIAFKKVEDGESASEGGVLIEGFGKDHAEIYEDFNLVQNTGYFIADKLFYPGDAFYNPGKNVEILALPVAGPWCRVKDSVKYALEIRPKFAFPVHDGALKILGGNHAVPLKFLTENGIKFETFKESDTIEL